MLCVHTFTSDFFSLPAKEEAGVLAVCVCVLHEFSVYLLLAAILGCGCMCDQLLSVYCSCMCLPVCLCDMCTDLLLIEHAKGKVTAMSPSLHRDLPGQQAGPQESDRRSSGAGVAKGGGHVLCCTSFKTYQLALGLFLPLIPLTCICQVCLNTFWFMATLVSYS